MDDLIIANKVVREELLKREDYYLGFLLTIESVLVEQNICTNAHDVAEMIVNRIIGD